MQRLSKPEVERINAGYCPDCGHRGFVLGPRGGMSTNIECGGCGSRFNIAQTSVSHHVVLWGERIPRLDEGGTDWTR
jgi:transcription elongation factor Elf1